MKTFLLKIAVFGVIQGLVATGLLWRYDTSQEANFLAATSAKHRRLAQTTPPRLIITGGSNVPFGIQSDLMEKALGKIVVNMGLAAGLGLDFMLAEIQPSLCRGDTVLISLEYDQFSGGFDPDVIQQVLVFRPASVRFLRPKHFRKVVLDRGLTLAGAIIRRAISTRKSLERGQNSGSSTEAHGYNAWGDLRAHYGKPSLLSPDAVERLVPPRREWPSPSAQRALTQFASDCLDQGVKVCFSFPPQQRERLNNDRDAVNQIERALKSIPNLVVLDTPDLQTYPTELFYDTGYHLNEQGAGLRTRRLIERLGSVQE
jgi:hypothetical protein